MNQKFTNVKCAAVICVFWGAVVGFIVHGTKLVDTSWGWLPYAVMVVVFVIVLVGLNWLTSESR